MIDDPELHALLSAYAAGTLTEQERQRLFEKALNNQTLFDALADEESTRAALAHPLVKQSLLRLLNQRDIPHPERRAAAAPVTIRDKAPNRWLWVAVAATLAIATATIALWPTQKPEPQIVAITNLPAPQPILPPPPAPKIVKSIPASAPPAQPSKEEKSASPLPSLADRTQTVEAPAARLEELNQTASSDARSSQRDFKSALLPAPERARAANIIQLPTAIIVNDALNLRTPSQFFCYAFLIDGDSIKPLPIVNPVTTDSPRRIPLGDHTTQAEVWLWFTPMEDPVLARAMTGVLPLPNRTWTKLKTNP